MLQQTVRRLKTSLARERDLRKQAEHQLADIKAKGKKGRAGRYFSKSGGLNLGIKANLCCSPQSALGLTLEVDVHHTSVTRWELMVDSCSRCSNFIFYRECIDAVTTPGDGGYTLCGQTAPTQDSGTGENCMCSRSTPCSWQTRVIPFPKLYCLAT